MYPQQLMSEIRFQQQQDRHAHAARQRTERVVDLHEPATLEAINRYVMDERPREAELPTRARQ